MEAMPHQLLQQAEPHHPLRNLLEEPEMLVKLLNEGIARICRKTYQVQKSSKIYDLENWPGITAANLACTKVWYDVKAELQTYNLSAPAVPLRATCIKGEWLASAGGNVEIAGPRKLRVIGDKSGNIKEPKGMERFNDPFDVAELVRGNGLYSSQHSLTFTYDPSEQHTSSPFSEALPHQVHYVIKREISSRQDHIAPGYVYLHEDQFHLYLVYHPRPHHVMARGFGESANVMERSA